MRLQLKMENIPEICIKLVQSDTDCQNINKIKTKKKEKRRKCERFIEENVPTSDIIGKHQFSTNSHNNTRSSIEKLKSKDVNKKITNPNIKKHVHKLNHVDSQTNKNVDSTLNFKESNKSQNANAFFYPCACNSTQSGYKHEHHRGLSNGSLTEINTFSTSPCCQHCPFSSNSGGGGNLKNMYYNVESPGIHNNSQYNAPCHHHYFSNIEPTMFPETPVSIPSEGCCNVNSYFRHFNHFIRIYFE